MVVLCDGWYVVKFYVMWYVVRVLCGEGWYVVKCDGWYVVRVFVMRGMW